jgi:hypothetical protein
MVEWRKSHIEMYQTKRDLSNPLFSNHNAKYRKFILFLLGVGVIYLMYWIILESQATRIRKIEINGLQTLDSKQFSIDLLEHMDSTKGLLPGLSVLRRYKSNIQGIIEGEYSYIEVTAIHRESNNLKIQVNESPRGVFFGTNGSWFLISEDEIVSLENIHEIEQRINHQSTDEFLHHKETPIVELEESTSDLSIIDNQTQNKIMMLDQSLREFYDPSFYKLPSATSSWIKVIGIEKVPLFIELHANIQQQIDALNEIKKTSPMATSYIDLRFAPRIYIK